MDAALQKLANETLASPYRVVKIDWHGRSAWVKKAKSDKSFLSRLFGGGGALRHEAACIEKFRAAGFTAPEVLGISDDWIVLDDIGVVIDTELKTMPDPTPGKIRAVALQCAGEIALLHQSGLSHGRCKLNDLVRTADGGIGFIDFEESGEGTLAKRQAREIWLFSLSLSRYEPQCPGVIDDAFAAYKKIYASPKILAELKKFLNRLRPATRVLSPLRKFLGGDPARAYDATQALLRITAG